MFRKSFIIKKENLFNWVEDKRVSKVEIANSYNKTLRDKSLCKIYVYFKLDIMEFQNIFKAIKREIDKVKISSDHGCLNGFQSLKGEGFISEKHIKKLLDIQKRNGINLSISKNIQSKIRENMKTYRFCYSVDDVMTMLPLFVIVKAEDEGLGRIYAEHKIKETDRFVKMGHTFKIY